MLPGRKIFSKSEMRKTREGTPAYLHGPPARGNMCGWVGPVQGLSDQKSTARRDHAHRDRRGLFSIHTKYGLLNRLPTKVSFSIFD